MIWVYDDDRKNYINLAHVTRFELRPTADGVKLQVFLAGSAVITLGHFSDDSAAREHITGILNQTWHP